MLIRWMDLHANDLPYGRWLAVGKKNVGTDWMDGQQANDLPYGRWLAVYCVGIGKVYDLIENNSGVNLS